MSNEPTATTYAMCAGAACFAQVPMEGDKCAECLQADVIREAYENDETARRYGVAFGRDDAFPVEMRGGHSHFCPTCNLYQPCEEYCSIERDLSTIGVYRGAAARCDACVAAGVSDDDEQAMPFCPPHFGLIEKHPDDYAGRCFSCEVNMLRGALKAIARDSIDSQSQDVAEAALCPHKWKTVTHGSPQEPRDTSVVCETCGVDQHEFYQMVGLEE